MKQTEDFSSSAARREWELQELARSPTKAAPDSVDASAIGIYRQISDALQAESLPRLPTNFATRIMETLAVEKRRRRSVVAALRTLVAAFVGYLGLLAGGFYLLAGGIADLATARPDAPGQWLLLAFGLIAVAAVLQSVSAARTRPMHRR